MLDFIEYTLTKAGFAQIMSMDGVLVEVKLLAVNAVAQGSYDIQGVGMPPRVGDYVLLPLKGAQAMSLKLPVIQQQDLITPDFAWQAFCDGPVVSVFNIHNMELECDVCHSKHNYEFVEFSADIKRDAVQAMLKLGWDANTDSQICPQCKLKKAEI